MRMRAGEKNLQLTLDQSSSFPRIIRGDAAKLRQMLINLVGNAVKYTEEGGVTVRLGAAPSEGPRRLLLSIEVEDTGIGIAAEDRARIFDPFVQLEKRAIRKGTGLGLAITREHVTLMGGTIGVESAPGKGSTFRVEITVERADESGLSGIRVSRGRVVGLEPGQPECRVLIVEDQIENWLLLRRLLEDAGFAVRVAEDGTAGVEAFREWRTSWSASTRPGSPGSSGR
jgi:anti-sigma regulatory factor (Ser/Thr protein kinase)